MTRLIDADALTDELIRESEADTSKSIQTSFAKSVCMILCKAIEQQPTIDAEPVKRGMWTFIRLTDKDYGHRAKECSSCGSTFFDTKQWNYCPNCGCRMDEE